MPPRRAIRAASAGEGGGDGAMKGVHLVEQLMERATPEPELHVVDAHRRELVQGVGDVGRGPRDRGVADVPAGIADVEGLGGDGRADVDRVVAPGATSMLEQERDLARQVRSGGALWEATRAPPP